MIIHAVTYYWFPACACWELIVGYRVNIYLVGGGRLPTIQVLLAWHVVDDVNPSLVSVITQRAILTRVNLIFSLNHRNPVEVGLGLAEELWRGRN